MWRISKYGRVIHKQGEIYQVNDTEYFGKIMGCDSAEIADLWNEYAIATKGKSCFRFGRGFRQVIDEYFEQHPDRDPVSASKPQESVIAPLKDEVYHLLYRNFKVEEVKRTIVGFVRTAGCNVSKIRDLLFEWLKKLFVGLGFDEPSEEDLFVSEHVFRFDLIGDLVGLNCIKYKKIRVCATPLIIIVNYTTASPCADAL